MVETLTLTVTPLQHSDVFSSYWHRANGLSTDWLDSRQLRLFDKRPITSINNRLTTKVYYDQLTWYPGGGILPHKGLVGTCGQPGYVFRDFCLKQGRKISDICLKQGQGMRGPAAPPHPGKYRVPPPGVIQLTFILKMTTAQVVETSATTLTPKMLNLLIIPKNFKIFDTEYAKMSWNQEPITCWNRMPFT